MTIRRLAVLVKALINDPTTATARACGIPDYTATEYLLADIREATTGGQVKNPWRTKIRAARKSGRAELAKKRARAFETRSQARKARLSRGG